MRRVFLLGTDISDRVSMIPNLVPECGEFGQVTLVPQITLEAINNDGFWESKNPASPFFGATDLSLYDVVIKIDEDIVFEGGVLSIQASGETYSASVTLQTALQIAMARGCEYATDPDASPGETPAAIIRNICLNYLIPIDPASFAQAEAIYSADNVHCFAAFTDPKMTVLDAIQRVAEIGCARVYAIGGTLAINVYTGAEIDPIFTFSDATVGVNAGTLWGAPVVEPIQKDKCQGYNVRWMFEPAAIFGPPTGTCRSIDGGRDQPVQISDADTAVWIGERWMLYLNNPQDRISFGVPVNYAAQLPLGSPVAIEYTTGFWGSAVPVELVSIDTGDGLVGRVVGLTK